MSSFFTDTILERGKDYYKKNKVFSINQYGDQTYTGIILGSAPYHTMINLDKDYNIIEASCDCPYAEDGHHCKHEAALYFAIEDRLPKNDNQYFDVKKLLKEIRVSRRDPYYINHIFISRYTQYLKSIREFNDDESLDIKNFQRTIDDLLEATYPQQYVRGIYSMTFGNYKELLTNDLSKEQTYTWLKEKIKYKRYRDVLNYLIPCIEKLDVDLQLDIYREVLKKNYSQMVLSQYISIVRKNHLDMKNYLEKINMYSTDETCITEMLRYYIEKDENRTANLYYKNYKKYIKTQDGKEKVKSIMNTGHEKDYYNYLITSTTLSYSENIRSVYRKIKEFYGDKYIDEFLDVVEDYYSEYQVGQMLDSLMDYKQLSYYLLNKADLRLFDNFGDLIKRYSYEMYMVIALECFKNYSKSKYGFQFFGETLYKYVSQLDEVSKIEFIEFVKESYVDKENYMEILNDFLEGNEDEYDEIQY